MCIYCTLSQILCVKYESKCESLAQPTVKLYCSTNGIFGKEIVANFCQREIETPVSHARRRTVAHNYQKATKKETSLSWAKLSQCTMSRNAQKEEKTLQKSRFSDWVQLMNFCLLVYVWWWNKSIFSWETWISLQNLALKLGHFCLFVVLSKFYLIKFFIVC